MPPGKSSHRRACKSMYLRGGGIQRRGGLQRRGCSIGSSRAEVLGDAFWWRAHCSMRNPVVQERGGPQVLRFFPFSAQDENRDANRRAQKLPGRSF